MDPGMIAGYIACVLLAGVGLAVLIVAIGGALVFLRDDVFGGE